jgi:hypothetical protein
MSVTTDHQLSVLFRECAAAHGLRLHRIHMLSATKAGSFPSTVVFDCRCGQRWLLRVAQGDVVGVDGALLDDLRVGRGAQMTAPPGFPAGSDGRPS